jgi:hypothetical protein
MQHVPLVPLSSLPTPASGRGSFSAIRTGTVKMGIFFEKLHHVGLSISAESATIQQCFSFTTNQQTVLSATTIQQNKHAVTRRHGPSQRSRHGYKAWPSVTLLDRVGPSFGYSTAGGADCRCLPLHLQSERRSICPPRPMLCHRYVHWWRSVTKPGSPAPATSGHAREGKSILWKGTKWSNLAAVQGSVRDREGMASHRCDCSLQPLRLTSCSVWWPPATWDLQLQDRQLPGVCVVTDVHAWPFGREDMWCHSNQF